jgi:hypothetical protein
MFALAPKADYEVISKKILTNKLSISGENIYTFYNTIAVFLNDNRLDDVEKVIKYVSDSRGLAEAMSGDNCTLDFFKRFVDYKFIDRLNKTPITKELMLYHAIRNGKIDIATYLVQERNVELPKEEIVKLLETGFGSGRDIESIKFLLENKIIDVNYFIESKKKYLIERVVYLCESECDDELTKIIIDLGADISVNDYSVIRTMSNQYTQIFTDILADLIIKLDSKLKENKGE